MESKVDINWDAVEAEMKSQEWEDDEFNDRKVRRVFLGTVMDLYPSGKFYTPWANSNVRICTSCAEMANLPCDEEHPCSNIDDLGDEIEEEHCEACLDAQFGEDLENEAEEHGYYIESGEGDPCDLFITDSKDIEEE